MICVHKSFLGLIKYVNCIRNVSGFVYSAACEIDFFLFFFMYSQMHNHKKNTMLLHFWWTSAKCITIEMSLTVRKAP